MLWEFIKYWGNNIYTGLRFSCWVFGIIGTICAIIAAGLLFQKKFYKDSWKRWEEFIMKIAFCLFILSFLIAAVFVAPFIKDNKKNTDIADLKTKNTKLKELNAIKNSLLATDSYQQPLITGKADVDVTIGSNKAINLKPVSVWGDWGPLILAKEEDTFLFMDLPLSNIRTKQIDDNTVRFIGTLELTAKDKAINKPICDLSRAECALIQFRGLPKESDVIEGTIIYTFNNLIRIEISIPPQPMKEGVITVPIKPEYFSAGGGS